MLRLKEVLIVVLLLSLLSVSGCVKEPIDEGLIKEDRIKEVPEKVNEVVPKKEIIPPGKKVDTEPISIEEDLCEDYYNGIKFDGFCFTDFGKTVFEQPKAENGLLKYTPAGSNVERTVRYPTSIKIIDFGINFDINVTLKNNGNSVEKVKFSNLRMYVYNTEDIDFNEEYVVEPGEVIDIPLPVNLPNSNARLGVNKYITLNDNDQLYYLPRIILYGDYNPFSEEEVIVKDCGGRKYAEHQGICNKNILFPAIEHSSCTSDMECNKYEPGLICYEYSCLYMEGNYNLGPKNKKYRVGFLPLYITDDDSQYSNMKNVVSAHLNEIIPKMENWFSNEKQYWNINNEFEFDYFKIHDDCKMTYVQFQTIHPVVGHMKESELREIENQCIDNKNYDILIISIQRDDNFPNFIGAGINFQTIMASALEPRTIIHELLHSFGEHDLYGAYQWGNCYLYNVNTGGDWNEEMPHLCKFEAMQLGWYPKKPH